MGNFWVQLTPQWQWGITCGANDEPRRSSKAMEKSVTVLRTGIMGHLSKSPTTISKISSNFGKISLKKMLGGVVLPPRTLFSPGVSFSQWTSQ